MRATRYFAYSGEVAIAALVVAVIGLMILPLPTPMIDTLLGINITLSVVLLMVTMYVPDSISLSSFPSLLLFTTLLRLSLNIASTKSILLHAEAGHIIESFGELVVGGNLVVGLVVFLIITTVQFIVIAKGSERVAEVGARFTLDAMPGKQMSIDADLRGGNLTADEARRKRARLAIESQLHGGMDGAMKFVKGDAIAGLVITMVNILAGIVVGVTYHGMTAGDAANRFAILSVGDAMVSQIASLLISVAAGVMITRVANENETKLSSLGLDIGRQLTSNARALMAASVLLACFAFVPGFPAVLFLLLAAAVGAGGYAIWRKQRDISGSDQRKLPSTSRKGAKGEAPHIRKTAPDFASPLSMRLSPQLAALLDPAQLDQAIESERHQLVELLGLPFPGIAIWQSESLQGMQYEVLIHDVPETRAELQNTEDMQGALARQAIAPACTGALVRRHPGDAVDVGAGGRGLSRAGCGGQQGDARPAHCRCVAASTGRKDSSAQYQEHPGESGGMGAEGKGSSDVDRICALRPQPLSCAYRHRRHRATARSDARPRCRTIDQAIDSRDRGRQFPGTSARAGEPACRTGGTHRRRSGAASDGGGRVDGRAQICTPHDRSTADLAAGLFVPGAGFGGTAAADR